MTRNVISPILLAASACGGGDLTLPAESSPAMITIVAGDGQTGRAGEKLADPIVVRVTNSHDLPVEGVQIAFTFDGGPGTSLVPETTTTDADGQASVQLQLGSIVGEGHGVARVTPSTDQALQAGFTATTVSASASGLQLVSGDHQTGRVGTKLASRLVVAVTDPFNNPKADVTISWSVTGGGKVSASTTKTGADGRTSVERTLGPTAGTQTTIANSPGLAGSPMTFTQTATPAAPNGVVVVAGNEQTGTVATRVPQDLVAEVRDASGNPVSGATLNWVVTAGGGSVDPGSGTSDADGRTSTHWTLGTAPGTNRVEARVAGASSAVFTATAVTGASASLAIVTQPSATAMVGVPFDQQPVVQLHDASGNNVTQGGVAVTAAIVSGDGTIAGTTTQTTNNDGRAVFTNLRITGAVGSHTLIFAANGQTSVTSNVIDVQKASTITAVVSDTPNPSAPGETVTVAFTVTSTGGTPTGTVTVTSDDGGSCSASVSTGSCALVLNTEGTRTLTVGYGGDNLFDASSITEAHTVQVASTETMSIRSTKH